MTQERASNANIAELRHSISLLGAKNKILVANRGEIPIRVFRSAHELSMRTVAIYSHQDKFAMHRLKADEAYFIGQSKQVDKYTPMGAYMAHAEILKIAQEHNVNFIHPGYGFLSMSPLFAQKVIDLGITWIGPKPDILDKVSNKIKVRRIANDINIPVVPGTLIPIHTIQDVESFGEKHGFPIIIKPAYSTHGKLLKVVKDKTDLLQALNKVQSEALTTTGSDLCYVEKYLAHPKYIEVQILADNYDNVVHLFERDCSAQKKHKKLLGIAPSRILNTDLRNSILTDSVKLMKHIGFQNAGTVEFLVDETTNKYYLLGIDPTIQIEHTITEEITGIDIVAAQIQIAAGASLPQLGLIQSKIMTRGFSIQCSITTEDPLKDFQPDTGRLEVYRSSGGNGVRLDGGNAFAGAIITPHYDPILVKCTCSGSTYEIVRRKMLRALIEFRIRGVKTNIPFLLALLTHPIFIRNQYSITFIDDTPQLFQMISSQNRAQKILQFLAELAVNGSSIEGQVGLPKLHSHPQIPLLHDRNNGRRVLNIAEQPPPPGWRKILLEYGPKHFAKLVRKFNGTLIMDTTWRDAQQSLLAGRIRTFDLEQIADTTAFALSGAFSLECWGGTTFEVCLKVLHEDPWDRLKRLRKKVPNIPFQMLLGSTTGVSYSSLPSHIIDHFVLQCKNTGIDIFRVFDSLNDLGRLKVGIDAVQKAGGVIEATICYSGDMLQPGKKYNLDYYLELTEKIIQMGTHMLCIKDMAGTLKPAAAKLLIGSLNAKYPFLPIHVHSHDSAGTAVTTMATCAISGADVVDVATNSMSGSTSQGSLNAFLASLDGEINTNINSYYAKELDSYWSQIRKLYSCFEVDMKGPDPSVYEHEIPGTQLSKLFSQTEQSGKIEKWEEIKDAYQKANILLGDIVKTIPTSNVVEDLAKFMVSNNLSPNDIERLAHSLNFPESVISFFQGAYGEPYGGFPEPLKTDTLRNKRRKLNSSAEYSSAKYDLNLIKENLKIKYGDIITDLDVASYNMFPKAFDEYQRFKRKYGDLSVLPTKNFLAPPVIGEEIDVVIEKGKTLIIKYQAIGDLNKGTGKREVYFELNGELRKIAIVDETTIGPSVKKAKPKVEENNPEHIGAPMSGTIVEVKVIRQGKVKKGDPIAVLSAMKMEMIISSSIDGEVQDILINEGDSVEASDLLFVIKPTTI